MIPFDGKLTFKEEEVSYVDQIFLFVTRKNGDDIKLFFHGLGEYKKIELISYGYFVLNE